MIACSTLLAISYDPRPVMAMFRIIQQGGGLECGTARHPTPRTPGPHPFPRSDFRRPTSATAVGQRRVGRAFP
ncbi:hypothetical protein GCM10009800_00360 [Nocardiopsis rhodophaea]